MYLKSNNIMDHIKIRIEKIERITFLGTILTFLFFATIGFTIGLFLLLGVIISVKVYIYTLYKKEGEVDEFWKKSSKPALASLVIISLLIVLEYYNVFQILF